MHKFIPKIAKKLNKKVSTRQLDDILNIINQYLYEEIINNKPIYIDNFGTISQKVSKSRKIWSKFKKAYVLTVPARQLVFRAHSVFLDLIEKKRKNFEKS